MTGIDRLNVVGVICLKVAMNIRYNEGGCIGEDGGGGVKGSQRVRVCESSSS